jgi:hypothetical protein
MKKLTVVSSPNPEVTPPPRPLGAAGTRLWAAVTTEYGLNDAGGIEILAQACAAADRAEELADLINKEGAVITVRGISKEHPALRQELANRAFVTRCIARLGLDVEPVRSTVGRPSGVY